MSIPKLFLLSFKRNIDCYYKDRRVYTICILIQAVIFTACIICSAYLFDNARIVMDVRESGRVCLIIPKVGHNVDKIEQKYIDEILSNNPYASIEQAEWMFATSYEGEYIQATALSDVSNLKVGVRGTKIDNTINTKSERVMVLPIFTVPEYAVSRIKDSIDVGQTAKLGDFNYEVIGIQNFRYDSVHIPLAAGINDFDVMHIEVILDVGVGERAKGNFTDYLERALPSFTIKPPMQSTERLLVYMGVYIIAGIIACICAVLAFVGMYLYFAQRDKKEFLVMCICGCSKPTRKALVIAQYSIMLSLCYAASAVVAEALLLVTGRELVKINQIGIIYLLFLAVLIAIMALRVSSKRHSIVR